MKTILITGASGFVGRYLSEGFLKQGNKVIGLGTSAGHDFEQEERFTWVSADTTIAGDWQSHVAGADVIINLAGRNIFKPWTQTYKQAIYDSRIKTTQNLVDAMGDAWAGQLISTSAVGYYGDRGDTELYETEPFGMDFLSQVCRDWEAQALRAEEKGARVAVMRLGVVLGHGGALRVMGRAFRFFMGGPLGSGRQWFPWIHIEDLARGIGLLISEGSSGVFNFTGPVPLRQKDFAKALGRALNRPAFMPAPAFMVKGVMGELGASLLQSQKALPHGLDSLGFSFLYQSADLSLEQIYGTGDKKNGG